MGQATTTSGDVAAPLVAGSFTSSTTGAAQTFWGYLNVSVWGTFVGTVQLERSFDGGTTWIVISRDVVGALSPLTAPGSFVTFEPEHQVQYRLNCTAYTSGTISYRLSAGQSVVQTGGY